MPAAFPEFATLEIHSNGVEFDLDNILLSPSAWHNEFDAVDTNADGSHSPIDALLIINHINRSGSGALQDVVIEGGPFFDTSGDGQLSPVDVLLVVNDLNSQPGGEGEREDILYGFPLQATDFLPRAMQAPTLASPSPAAQLLEETAHRSHVLPTAHEAKRYAADVDLTMSENLDEVLKPSSLTDDPISGLEEYLTR